MELLIAILTFVLSAVAAIVCNLIASEFYCRSPRLADLLGRCAVAQLPEQQRERYREEWQADILECEGNLSKVCRAIGFMIAARRLSQFDKPVIANNAELAADLVALLRKYRELEAHEGAGALSNANGLILLELKSVPSAIGMVENLAAMAECSHTAVAAALVEFGLKHKHNLESSGKQSH